jgi:hypothetical protein
MSKPEWWKWEVTPGNVVSWIVIAVGLVLAYSRVESRVDETAKMVIRLEASDTAMNARIEAARELATGRQEAVLTRLARMEAILERIEKNGGSR